jgi:DNA-binding PadR family transcriptional regulator
MEEAGWIKASWITTENKRRARLYEITAVGRQQLQEEENHWRAITAAVGNVLQRA